MNRSDYAFHPLAWEQYQQIIQHGSFPNVPEPMLTRPDYDSLIAVLAPADIDPRLPLAFTWAEGHDGTDPGLVAASVNNLGGIKFAGTPGTYDSGIAADTGGTYAGFPDLTGYWQEWVRIMNNSIIGPSFTSGDLIGAVEHYTNGPGTGHNKVDQFLAYQRDYPPEGVPMVTPEMVVAAAMAHAGQSREFDGWNGDHAVSLMCEADVEDWYTEAGLPVPHYASAAAAGDAAPLNPGYAPAGAQVFFRGAGWSVNDHTGISLGGGRTISGLATVTISDGWQDLPTYRGWRQPPGIALAPAADNSVNGHILAGGFRALWDATPDRMRAFGNPTTEEYSGFLVTAAAAVLPVTIQEFERTQMVYDLSTPDPFRVRVPLRTETAGPPDNLVVIAALKNASLGSTH